MTNHNDFKNYFFSAHKESIEEYKVGIHKIVEKIIAQLQTQPQPYSGKSPIELLKDSKEINFFPFEGSSLESVIEKTNAMVVEHNVATYHPLCTAHLHCPVFIGSLVAEIVISAFNQSMDSWDQAPAASMIEQEFCNQLCKLYGFGEQADAIFTSGGTMSNFMGILLARDAYSEKAYNWNIQKSGMPPEYKSFRIICAEHAHFSIEQSASILGLGSDAVIRIGGKSFEEEASLLEDKIIELKSQGLIPIAYVSTTGTTDYGSYGNIEDLAVCTQKHDLWLHIDAAYGGALIFSEQHKYKLKGIEHADSVTVDFHKLFFQPISCGAFIVKNKSAFEYIRLHADYLNPESNEDLGILDLVYKSIQTTRRFDALKPFIALQHVGIKKMGEMIDYTIGLAKSISVIIENDPRLELATKPQMNSVVFRFVPEENISEERIDEINDAIKTKLLLSGKAIIGQTRLNDKAYLKFTLLNPMTEENIITDLLDEIKLMGHQMMQSTLETA